MTSTLYLSASQIHQGSLPSNWNKWHQLQKGRLSKRLNDPSPTKSRAVKSWKSPQKHRKTETAPPNPGCQSPPRDYSIFNRESRKKPAFVTVTGRETECIPNRKEYKSLKSRRDESEDFQHLHLKFWLVQYLNIFSCTCSSILTFGYASKLNPQQLDKQTVNCVIFCDPETVVGYVSSLEGNLIVSYKYATMSAMISTNSHPASPAALSSE